MGHVPSCDTTDRLTEWAALGGAGQAYSSVLRMIDETAENENVRVWFTEEFTVPDADDVRVLTIRISDNTKE
jgi:hypothetical protein